MRWFLSLLIATAVALSTSGANARTVKSLVESYKAAIDVAVEAYNKAHSEKATGKPFNESAWQVRLYIDVAKDRRSDIDRKMAELNEEGRAIVLAKLKSMDAKLSETEKKLRLLLPSIGSRSGGSHSRVDGIIKVRGSSSTHREQDEMLLLLGDDGGQSRHFIVDRSSILVEIKPLLLRAFLEDRLGSEKKIVATDVPLDIVASDVVELIEKLKTAKPEVIRQFVASFTLRESELFMRQMDAEALGDAGRSQIALLRFELAQEANRRVTELEGLGMKGDDLHRVDASLVARKWLSDKNSRDARFYGELLKGANLDINLAKPGERPVLLPVRAGSRVNVGGSNMVAVDNFKFMPDQIRSIELPRAASHLH